ncbi:MAG: hypothetical protein C4342_02930, partial [Armatimonadota bacterium]
LDQFGEVPLDYSPTAQALRDGPTPFWTPLVTFNSQGTPPVLDLEFTPSPGERCIFVLFAGTLAVARTLTLPVVLCSRGHSRALGGLLP